MKTEGWGARILLLLVLCLVGVSAVHLKIGTGLGLAIGIGALAIAVEALFVKLPIEDVIYTVVGATAGLLLGLLVMLLLRLGNVRIGSPEGTDPLLMIPLALGYAFAHVSLVRGRKLGVFKAGEEAAMKVSPTLVDLSAIVDGRVADMVIAGLLSGPFVMPAGVRPSLEAMMKSKDIVQRGRARRGIETLERLEEAAGKSGGIESVDFGEGERERYRMLDWLRKERCTLLSADRDFLDMSSREGSRVIRLDEVGAATRSVVLPGEKLRLKPVRRGKNSGQAVGYLNDGTMIVVEDGEEQIGKMVEAVAHTTFRASGGTMVFARLAQQEEEAPAEAAQADPGPQAEDDVD
jgi:uncharacterized protein YacL